MFPGHTKKETIAVDGSHVYRTIRFTEKKTSFTNVHNLLVVSMTLSF